MPDGPVVALTLLLVGGALVALYFFIDYRRHRGARGARGREVERIPLFGTDLLATRGEDGSLHTEDGAPLRPPVRRTPGTPRVTLDPLPSSTGTHATPTAGRANGAGYAPPRAEPPAFGPPGAARRVPALDRAPLAGATAVAGPDDAALVNGETLRFAVADEGTLRFLPGRLEVSAGPDAGREVRFVAPPGGDPVEITFGRTEGPAYRHIQLLARTVSRRHARMQLTDDHWSLQNLSATNPVVLNGRQMAPDEVAPLLVDGDRIEMGEVVFTFHSR